MPRSGSSKRIYRVRGWRVTVANVGLGLPIIFIALLCWIDDIISLDITLWAILIGVLIILAGLLINMISVPFVRLQRGETKFTARNPSIKPPFARVLFSIPFFVATAYLIGFTNVPYAVPFVIFIVGVYFYFRGVVRFWINQHTLYFVTNRGRVVRVYRMLGLDQQEIMIHTNTSVSQKRSLFEMLTGRGNVLVSNSFAKEQQIHWQEIDNSSEVVGRIKGHISRAR